MRSLTEQDIRTSFINCSKGEAKRLALPRDLDERPWGDLDFLGWRDPGAPDRSYLVTEREERLVGVTLARKAGTAGREGNSVGVYMCTDLACSLYVRGKKIPQSGIRIEESLTVDEQIARTTGNLSAFLDKLYV